MSAIYIVGHNMPGYLPESDVYDTEEWEDAKLVLIDELERLRDFFDMGIVEGEGQSVIPAVNEALDAARALKLHERFYFVIDNCAYWLERSRE